MWQDALKKVHDMRCKFYGSGVNPGAPMESITLWEKCLDEDFGITLPTEYTEMLKVSNGVEWNGFILYGVDNGYFPEAVDYSVYGFIEQNAIWHENPDQKKYIFFGESNISWYVYDLQRKCYMELDNPSGCEMQEYQSFEGLFEKLLEDSLQ